MADAEASRGHRGSANLRVEAFLAFRVLVAKVTTIKLWLHVLMRCFSNWKSFAKKLPYGPFLTHMGHNKITIFIVDWYC